MEVIDAKNCILGRLATEVAKKALNGEEIIIINAEQAAISGKKEAIFKKYLERRKRGTPQHGPFFPSNPDQIVRRAIRGMLPYKTKKGKEAFKRIKTFVGIPEKYKNLESKKIGKQIDELKCNFVFIHELSKFLKGKK
ncbi:MAG: 50S ribosomal protein L13 [Candidatus Aenigmatarchaeota archaeon]|nr:MAG: 50S ribosomal protein L13 [Candidatus Aenigmarchaeota archaeon]